MRPSAALATVRQITETLPRSYEVLVHDRVKFRVGSIVYVAFSSDERRMGFAFPMEEREALVASEPAKYLLPGRSDMRFNWVVAELAEIELDELTEVVLAAWKMVVPKKVAARRLTS